MGNYLNRLPDGCTPLGKEKAYWLSMLHGVQQITELPDKISDVPQDKVLIAVADNGGFEAALVCDNDFDLRRVKAGNGRPVKFFLLPRTMVRKMADKPLESDLEILAGKNINEPELTVEFFSLKEANPGKGSWRRSCPKCELGVLLIGRDRENSFILMETDRCVLCGQRVRYSDIERMREQEL